jgi:undecaprenyl-diphosphatase
LIKIKILILVLVIPLFSFEFDKKVKKDESTIWKIHYEIPRILTYSVILSSVIEGSESRFGKTSWRAFDSFLIGQAITETLKRTTNRVRPRHTDSPNQWFKGSGNKSFPSGHVSSVTSLVTPFILEYRKDYPAIYLLALLPIHQMISRVKAQAHWQSDVTVGALIGVLSGYYSYKREYPLTLYFSKNKSFVGLRYKF